MCIRSLAPVHSLIQVIDLGPDLHKAAASGDSSAVQRLIGDGVDVNSQDAVCVPQVDW